MLSEADIREALRVCYDPELQINIVDLGRVHAIYIESDTEAPGPDARVRVIITLLSRDEQRDALVVAQATNRLLGLRAVSRVEFSMSAAPAWTPDRMTPSARREFSKQQGLIQIG